MTDAAVSVAQSAVENFAEQYLRSLDCKIEKDGERWQVTIPERPATMLPEGEFVLLCGEEESELEEDQEALNPKSSFFQELLTEASEAYPIGGLTLNFDGEIELPPWLNGGDIEVTSTDFTPYYDRTAVVLLYSVSIETVSEYQTESLQIVALDNRTMNVLTGLERAYLQQTAPQESAVKSRSLEISRDRIDHLIEESREKVVDRVDEKIDEIHKEASRAADAELEEYRQMQHQRLEELEDDLSAFTSRIDELNETFENGGDRERRVQSLKKRKKLRSEREELESELQELRQAREQGFPEKQREIRDRHDLEVVVKPLTISQVEYERGELEIELLKEDTSKVLTVGYGEGIGITEDINCEECGQPLTAERPLQTIQVGLLCEPCAGMP